MEHVIATIGYEGIPLPRFIAALRAAKVDLLIDVRDVPWSRKPGFSKKALAAVLGEAGIDYLHLQALGDPKDGRDAARAGDMVLFEKIFDAHLAKDEAVRELAQAGAAMQKRHACLMCFEAAHEKCHRRIIAAQLQTMTGLRVNPLSVRNDNEAAPRLPF